MVDNLWPTFGAGKSTRSPKTVIIEVGEGLKEKTNGVVEFYSSSPTLTNDQVGLQFTFWVPSLRYHFPFMRAQYSIETQYPVKVVAHKLNEVVVNNENELIETLAKIFNAPSTIETVEKLMSLAKG